MKVTAMYAESRLINRQNGGKLVLLLLFSLSYQKNFNASRVVYIKQKKMCAVCFHGIFETLLQYLQTPGKISEKLVQ